MSGTSRGWGLVACSCALAACNPAHREAEEAVRRLLTDPQSAQFSEMKQCGKSAAVTGKVNAKNAFGGYTGPQIFYYANHEAGVVGVLDDGAFLRAGEACNKAMSDALTHK